MNSYFMFSLLYINTANNARMIAIYRKASKPNRIGKTNGTHLSAVCLIWRIDHVVESFEYSARISDASIAFI